MKKTSVVILNWNGKKLLGQFLPSVLRHSLSHECEVIVADNGSDDGSVEFLKNRYPDVGVMALDKNYGFAEGYNKAIRQLQSEYVVLLNSDVETAENWLHPLVAYLDAHRDVAAVQPKIRSYKQKNMFEYAGAAGGFIDRFGYPFCRGRILDVVEEDRGQYDSVIPVFWATGACLCIRRADFEESGGLDARFFAHMEEIDLCWRLNARGRKVACVPSSVVYHVGGASLNKENPRKTYLNFRNNLLMLYKNVPQRALFFTFVARYGLDFLAFAHLLVQGSFKNAQAVVRAHRDFLKMRSSYRQARRENLQKTIAKSIPSQYSGSILWNFYVLNRKVFSALRQKR